MERGEEERGAERRMREKEGEAEQRVGSGEVLVPARGMVKALKVALKASGTCEECPVASLWTR